MSKSLPWVKDEQYYYVLDGAPSSVSSVKCDAFCWGITAFAAQAAQIPVRPAQGGTRCEPLFVNDTQP